MRYNQMFSVAAAIVLLITSSLSAQGQTTHPAMGQAAVNAIASTAPAYASTIDKRTIASNAMGDALDLLQYVPIELFYDMLDTYDEGVSAFNAGDEEINDASIAITDANDLMFNALGAYLANDFAVAAFLYGLAEQKAIEAMHHYSEAREWFDGATGLFESLTE